MDKGQEGCSDRDGNASDIRKKEHVIHSVLFQ